MQMEVPLAIPHIDLMHSFRSHIFNDNKKALFICTYITYVRTYYLHIYIVLEYIPIGLKQTNIASSESYMSNI